jgi:hypothetical protein
MNAHSNSSAAQSPPPYPNNPQFNQLQHEPINYHRPAEERMVDFQQLVARYESKFMKRKCLDKCFAF